ncbi:MAG TPA: sugar phosphate nucleotidyltransferase [Candidatus Limiplasma sp.]|nr:sugar phosphate nucleotidyltransferase [Candidatus Limiplasma sp.]HPS81526.1 sugar phosphate nucleotidyltransferase [Candidatus Limiplasma sp.]
MQQKPILVIMAAGLGSRYGGLKQIDPVDDRRQIIIDYSIYDAVRAGFGKVICVIKPEMEADFREVIGDRIAPFVDLAYAYQRPDTLPAGFTVPEGRVKPWGTAHALLSAKPLIDAPFAVINADDFYGRTAYRQLVTFLSEPHGPGEHAMVGYDIKNTLTENGHVARGVCKVENGRLTEIVERTYIVPREGGAAFSEDGEHFTFLPNGTVVSMNFWGFQPSLMDEVEARFAGFLKQNLPENPLKCEYFLPLVPNQLIHEGKATVTVLPTQEKWYGVTYRDDMRSVRKAIARMVGDGLYPQELWRA